MFFFLRGAPDWPSHASRGLLMPLLGAPTRVPGASTKKKLLEATQRMESELKKQCFKFFSKSIHKSIESYCTHTHTYIYIYNMYYYYHY